MLLTLGKLFNRFLLKSGENYPQNQSYHSTPHLWKDRINYTIQKGVGFAESSQQEQQIIQQS